MLHVKGSVLVVLCLVAVEEQFSHKIIDHRVLINLNPYVPEKIIKIVFKETFAYIPHSCSVCTLESI